MVVAILSNYAMLIVIDREIVCNGNLGGVILNIWSWWSIVVAQFEFGFVSAALS